MRRRLSMNLIEMTRRRKQMLMLAVDTVLLLFAAWAAYSLRFGVPYDPSLSQVLIMLMAPVLAVPVFVKMGLYRSVIRFMGEHALWSVVKAVSLAALLWAVSAFMTQMTGGAGVPRSVPLLYWLLALVLIGGVRFVARWMLWLPVREQFQGRQVLIYGAGGAGRQLAASLSQGRDYFPAGFLDDNAALQGTDVAGLRVYPPVQLPDLMANFDIHDVIVTLPSASQARRKEVVSFLDQHGAKVRILPTISDIASGKHLVNLLREVDIGDLLGRDAVAADRNLLGRNVIGKSVLVTGAGGSIGSELCRQIIALKPAKLVLLEQSEPALYQIDRALWDMKESPVIPCLGSVTDSRLVAHVLREQGIQTVYHAAAHKHVPLVEANVLEGARNNVFGTRVLAQESLAAGVETFVLISTDKAVRPTNVMGATKRWAELAVHEAALQATENGRSQRFCAVRFGNVLGSSGSVIPLFRDQIAQGGPVTVTHAEVTRYFMSIHEAVELVIQAGSMAEGGEVFLLDMGEPVKIMDLARNMIELAGRTVRDDDNPSGDIDIIVTGLRPGEKLYEELLIEASNGQATQHPRIMKASEASHLDCISDLLRQLEGHLAQRDIQSARTLLMDVATGAGDAHASNVSDALPAYQCRSC
ncbi:MAG: nucleoside-diphosphate sugar epimerase/dehydratase [Betaproteobacteria bacterium]|nr:nucleoside-diphosphate sugar epimerase/dehydratase [Betaproteobacteria bacterium]